MVARAKDLWELTQTRIQIDPRDLTEAVEAQIRSGDLDYRTRLLIRDSLLALRSYWGDQRVDDWLQTSPTGKDVKEICNGPWDDDRGFRCLKRCVMDVTRPETIQQYFRELGGHVRRRVRLEIGGSAALILPGLLSRQTQDIDVVDEVPEEIRSRHSLLEDLAARYKLELAHFQQHYLPSGWKDRVHYYDTYGEMTVGLVDVHDVFLSKLFSARTKDLDDCRLLLPQLEKETIVCKLKDTTQSMLVAPGLREKAEKNWYILYGEKLPA